MTNKDYKQCVICGGKPLGNVCRRCGWEPTEWSTEWSISAPSCDPHLEALGPTREAWNKGQARIDADLKATGKVRPQIQLMADALNVSRNHIIDLELVRVDAALFYQKLQDNLDKYMQLIQKSWDAGRFWGRSAPRELGQTRDAIVASLGWVEKRLAHRGLNGLEYFQPCFHCKRIAYADGDNGTHLEFHCFFCNNQTYLDPRAVRYIPTPTADPVLPPTP